MVLGAAVATEPGYSAVSLLVLGLAVWHWQSWGLGKLGAAGLLAGGLMGITLVDPGAGAGAKLWEQGFTGADLVGRWILVASSVVVLVGVLLSSTELIRSPDSRSNQVAGSLAWWKKWGVLVVGALLALWILNLLFKQEEGEPPIDTTDEGVEGVLQDEAWTISADGDTAGSYVFHMVKTFSLPDEADVDDPGGRFVWPETAVDLCDVEIQGIGEGYVQIGILSVTTEGCPGMLEAFVDFGMPDTACLQVRLGGVDDEHCVPLALE